MPTVVSLRDVVNGIDGLPEGFTSYLNRQTGEVYTLQDEEADLVEEDAEVEDLPAWQRDELPKIREVLDSEDWLALPTSFEIHEWSIMERFSHSVEDAAVRNELLDAIHGRGTFRYFKDAIHRRRIQDAWYAYRTAALEEIAIDWLEERGIPYEADPGSAPAHEPPHSKLAPDTN